MGSNNFGGRIHILDDGRYTDDSVQHPSSLERLADLAAGMLGALEKSTVLTGGAATREAVAERVRDADVLHLACHGRFRPDNPLFSALRLGDGWLTVRDAYELALDGRLVTLSACETGISGFGPGDELIGLVRGFLSAGAPSLVVSLWTVDDESTQRLMEEFYARLRSGAGPGSALRTAQQCALRYYEHPFFWAPFALFGRW